MDDGKSIGKVVLRQARRPNADLRYSIDRSLGWRPSACTHPDAASSQISKQPSRLAPRVRRSHHRRHGATAAVRAPVGLRTHKTVVVRRPLARVDTCPGRREVRVFGSSSSSWLCAWRASCPGVIRRAANEVLPTCIHSNPFPLAPSGEDRRAPLKVVLVLWRTFCQHWPLR